MLSKLKNSYDESRSWLIITALKKVSRHFAPLIITAITGYLSAQELGFIAIQEGYLVINLHGGIEWLILALGGLAVGCGVYDNRLKFNQRNKTVGGN